MDPISQGALGAVLPQSLARREQIRAFGLLGFLSGMAPDVDWFIRSSADPLLFLEYHRQFSHSLIFVPFGAAICTAGLFWFVRRRLRLRDVYLACLLGYATHGLLDACTSYGTQLFWPFSNTRIAWNSVSVIDPLFTLPVLICIWAGAIFKKRRYAVIGLVWALTYLVFGAIQHQRAISAAETMITERGHTPNRLGVKPSFANLLLWKIFYEQDGRYHVDALRVAVNVSVCEGQNVEKLDSSRDLAWLNPGSQQFRDLERFRWFSSGYLALDRDDELYVVDIRYSSLPNEIDPLWGIRLDPGADDDRHAEYHVVRSRRSDDMPILWNLLAGKGCDV